MPSLRVAREGKKWVVLKVRGRVDRADLPNVLASVLCSSLVEAPKSALLCDITAQDIDAICSRHDFTNFTKNRD